MHAGISTVMRKLYVAMCRVSCFLPVMQKTENIQPVPFLKWENDEEKHAKVYNKHSFNIS